jgi:hypothetical protein
VDVGCTGRRREDCQVVLLERVGLSACGVLWSCLCFFHITLPRTQGLQHKAPDSRTSPRTFGIPILGCKKPPTLPTLQFNTALYDTRNTAQIAVLEVQIVCSIPILPPSMMLQLVVNSTCSYYTNFECGCCASTPPLLAFHADVDRPQSQQNTRYSSLSFVAPSHLSSFFLPTLF